MKNNKMELITEIPKSNHDKKISINLPSKLTEELAEFVGIVIGDGHLSSDSRRDNKSFSIRITCSLSEDNIYFQNVIQHLFKKLFNTKLSLVYYPNNNHFIANSCSKSVVLYLNRNFSIPIGEKSSQADIPKKIIESEEFLLSFIRGLSDTDFSLSFKNKSGLHNYPVIKGSFKSRILVENLDKVLTNFGFSTNVGFYERNFDKRFNKNYERHSIYLSGRENLGRWMDLIGFKNPRLLTRYLIWEKFGYCPPDTNLNERITLLSIRNGPGRIRTRDL